VVLPQGSRNVSEVGAALLSKCHHVLHQDVKRGPSSRHFSNAPPDNIDSDHLYRRH
jgi:hypothetical protein